MKKQYQKKVEKRKGKNEKKERKKRGKREGRERKKREKKKAKKRRKKERKKRRGSNKYQISLLWATCIRGDCLGILTFDLGMVVCIDAWHGRVL